MNGKRITEANDGLRLYTDNVGNYLTLLRPSSLAANASITLPTVTGEILTGEVAWQSAGDSFASDTTVAPISGLTLPLEAGAVYQIEAFMVIRQGAGYAQVQIDVPAGSTSLVNLQGSSASSGTFGNPTLRQIENMTPGAPLDISALSNTGVILHFTGRITTVAAGNVVLSGAQAVSNPAATSFEPQGYIKATRIS